MSVSLIYLRQGVKDGECQRWSESVRGVILKSDEERLSQGHSEDEGNIRTGIKYRSCLLFKRLYAAGSA